SLGTLSTGGRALQTLSVGSGMWLSSSVAYSGREFITGHDFYGNPISRMAAAENATIGLARGKADVILPAVARPIAGALGRGGQMMASAGHSIARRLPFFGGGVGPGAESAYQFKLGEDIVHFNKHYEEFKEVFGFENYTVQDYVND